MRKLSDINFNYTFRLKPDLSRSVSSKNPDQTKIILKTFQFTKHVQHMCYLSFVLQNLKLKTEVFID